MSGHKVSAMTYPVRIQGESPPGWYSRQMKDCPFRLGERSRSGRRRVSGSFHEDGFCCSAPEEARA